MRRRIVAPLLFCIACGGGAKPASTTPLAPKDANTADAAPATDGAAAATPDAGTLAAPSTGKELPKPPPRPRPSKEDARKLLAAVLAKAKAPNHECAKVLDPGLSYVLDIAAPDGAMVKADEQAYVALARCAEKQGYYLMMLGIASALERTDATGGHPELVARAMIGLNATTDAEAKIERLLQTRKDDANVQLTASKLACREKQWDKCLTRADAALALAPKAGVGETKEVALRAQKYRARSSLHLGKLDQAERAISEAEKLGLAKADIDELRAALVPARATRLVVDEQHSPELPLGIYHLYGKVSAGGQPLSLVALHVDNIDTKDAQVKVEVEVPGVTEHATQTLTLLKGRGADARLAPPLKTGFDVLANRAERAVQLVVKVTNTVTNAVVLEQSYNVTMEPRDILPRRHFLDKQRQIFVVMDELLGAWVTPNAKPIDAFLTEAKKAAPRATFSGEQTATLPQVKAIYETLQAKGVSYVMDPDVVAEENLVQRTRLPAEVLESTNAQCLEGTLLYASLLEAIGLRPVIVRVPGHVFVGWHPSPTDPKPPNNQTLYFLETTMTHDATFEKAVETAFKEVDAHTQAKRFSQPAQFASAARVEISPLRRLGYTPQPYD